MDAFKAANDVLLGAVQGIADLITHPGVINVDFADVKTVMSEMGMAMMGTGVANGEDRATQAAEKAIRSPLLDDIDLTGARGILVNITGGPELGLGEFAQVGEIVEEIASETATVVVGTSIDPEMTDEIKVTVVATGIGRSFEAEKPVKVVDNTSAKQADGQVDYRQLDRPTVMRNKPVADESNSDVAGVAKKAVGGEDSIEYLDIPAFLRRQAD